MKDQSFLMRMLNTALNPLKSLGDPQITTNPSHFAQVKQAGVSTSDFELFMPTPEVFHTDAPSYMATSNCIFADFLNSQYIDFCNSIYHPFMRHRKLWEFAFITEHFKQANVLRDGKLGIGFGVGNEPLPALYASLGCNIFATDAPPGVADDGWKSTSQWAEGIDQLARPNIISNELLRERVRFGFADMNAIDTSLGQYDFCWSACCFEHLGSIELGLEFVIQSVEKVLRIGGVACHTSELNLTSNEQTLETGGTVLFRRRDIELLIKKLIDRGHHVKLLPIEAGGSFIDHLVDVPPYTSDVHLKIRLGEFVTTSFGIVVTRGK